MLTVDEAWEKYHEELEQVCWAAHLPLPHRLARSIIASWMMRLVFYFTWNKAAGND